MYRNNCGREGREPNLADLDRKRVMRLEEALTHEDSRAGAIEALTGLPGRNSVDR